ncbi:MAG: hypothetical protein KDD47_26105 [Acidobacteria bacterium]|nr:hypothetical protein [Acidobacteriota bacterium]
MTATTIPRLVAEALALLGGSLFLLAACTKLATPRSAMIEPLTALGFPASRAEAVPIPLGLAELVAAVAIVLERGPLASFLVALLAVLFLGAGVLSLTRGVRVTCHCFGSGGGRLGWPQVTTFPLWLAVAALPWIPSFTDASQEQRWLAFTALVGVVFAVLAARTIRLYLAARALRLAIGPMR